MFGFICSQCGYRAPQDRDLTLCPACTSKASASSSQMTIIESASGGKPASGSSSTLTNATPQRVDGYEIISLLGSGGMGSVFLAYEPLLDREVAMKILSRSSEDADRAVHAARFLSEAVLTGKLGHAGIIPIYRVGFDSIHGYYYTMRYLRGNTLTEILSQLQKKDPAALEKYSLTHILSIFLRVCEAVGFAHAHGVVHRDIKPGNIMVTEFEEVLVLDWGLAKQTRESEISTLMAVNENQNRLQEARSRHGSTSQIFLLKDKKPTGTSLLKQLQSARGETTGPITKGCQIMGTPGFLSPEQGMGKTDVEPSSDVYSLGVTLYQLLTLSLPVDEVSATVIIAKTIVGEIVPLKTRLRATANLPSALCEIVNRALSLKPEDRYQNANEMAADLRLYLEGKGAWKLLVEDSFSQPQLSSNWKVLCGVAETEKNAIKIQPDSEVRCLRLPMGDFRCDFRFWSLAKGVRWSLKLRVLEVLGQDSVESRHEIRIGVEERPYIELLVKGRRVQRRFDIRLQVAQIYDVRVELEQGRVRVWLGQNKLIDFMDVFPQTGGAVEFRACQAEICVSAFKIVSRGAPLNLSFMALPDQLYRTSRFEEARELYRQLAMSHPDREEGLIALYKAGMCSVAMKDIQRAFDEFARLEGSMYEHYCALGLAQIGLQDGNIEWAWEALKNSFRAYQNPDIRREIWFALLGLVEHLGDENNTERITRYRELVSELNPEPHELSQVAFVLLELVNKHNGAAGVRNEAISLLNRFDADSTVSREALIYLGRVGLNEQSLPVAKVALDKILVQNSNRSDVAKLELLRAEIAIAESNFTEASSRLRNVVLAAGAFTPEGMWAKCWQVLIQYLQGQFAAAICEAHEAQVRYRRTSQTHRAYLHLIEAAAYYGKKQVAQALSALRMCESAGAEDTTIWSIAAQHVRKKREPSEMILASSKYGSAICAEAFYLTAELLLAEGRVELAVAYYSCCTNPAYHRSMIARLVDSRLRLIQANAKG